jgi:hypothetical protein
MHRSLVLISVVLLGCSVRVDRGYDASAGDDAGADAESCVCDFLWLRIMTPGDPPIRCYPRGTCSPEATCVPVLPLTEEPSCRFR